jgi:hypothetical protein
VESVAKVDILLLSFSKQPQQIEIFFHEEMKGRFKSGNA